MRYTVEDVEQRWIINGGKTMTDATYFEIVGSISQFLIALTLICICDRLGLLCRILCGCQCERDENDEDS